MRQYRGLTKDGEWVYGWYVKAKTCSVIVPQNCHVYEFLSDSVEVIPETVGQNTGLKDKNGKEIYEGDIVEYPNAFSGKIQRTEVTFCHGSFSFGVVTIYERLGSLNGEVIGNIHENPDLIKEVQ